MSIERGAMYIPAEYTAWVQHNYTGKDILLRHQGDTRVKQSIPNIYMQSKTLNPFYNESKDPPAFEYIDIESLLLRSGSMVLAAEAGMGKTTTVKHILYATCIKTGHPGLNGYLPVMIELKDFRAHSGAENFKEQICLYLEDMGCPLGRDVISGYLLQGKLLLLLDGLDEVREELRPQLVEEISRFQAAHRNNLVLMTGRPHSMSTAVETCFNARIHYIMPPRDREIEAFMVDWLQADSNYSPDEAQRTAHEWFIELKQNETISTFLENPLKLAAICYFKQDGGQFSFYRARLYHSLISNFVNRRFYNPLQKEKPDRVLDFLKQLAFENQEKNRTSFETETALRIMEEHFPAAHQSKDNYRQWIETLFREIVQQSGLLKHASNYKYRFSHLCFQEFLAAKYMVDMDIPWRQFLDSRWWHETLLLYIGFISIDQRSRGNKIISQIVDMDAHLFLAGEALRDLLPSKREKEVLAIVKNKFYRLMESPAELKQRLRAGNIICHLGDERILEHHMVYVSPGDFIRGTQETDFQANPQQRVYLDGFHIGKYPVSNGQYKLFIKQKGYEREEFWTAQGWQWRKDNHILRNYNTSQPRYWHERKYNADNCPVVGVTWFEAVAYCNWLSNETGKIYRLPYEAEWEKAAAGTAGKHFPWGESWKREFCNSNELEINRPCTIGIFPYDQSDYGCSDLAGNVSEWCMDYWSREYNENDLTNPRGPANGTKCVARGGCWTAGSKDCRNQRRGANNMNYRNKALGFRLLEPAQ